jgi:hypothetical protein
MGDGKAPTFCFPCMDPDTTETVEKQFKTVYTRLFSGYFRTGMRGFFRSWFCPISVCFIALYCLEQFWLELVHPFHWHGAMLGCYLTQRRVEQELQSAEG